MSQKKKESSFFDDDTFKVVGELWKDIIIPQLWKEDMEKLRGYVLLKLAESMKHQKK